MIRKSFLSPMGKDNTKDKEKNNKEIKQKKKQTK